MIKFLLILFLFIYLIYKAFSFVFRVFYIVDPNQKQQDGFTSRPSSNKKSTPPKKGKQPGEYIDYEEVE